MTDAMKILTLIAATGLITTLVLPGRQTAKVIESTFTGVTKWQKAAQGR
jgi:hypothetical protein